MKLAPEWHDRLRHWTATLEKDFYRPLGEISFEGFCTYDHITQQEALEHSGYAPVPAGNCVGAPVGVHVAEGGDYPFPQRQKGK